MSGAGKLYTAALCVGGRNPPPSYLATTESWNGSSWSTVNSLNTARATAAGQTGTSSSALAVGGIPGYVTNNEDWNGVSWTEVADLSTGRSGAGGAAADSTSAIIYGGYNAPNYLTSSEIWSNTTNTTKTITTD